MMPPRMNMMTSSSTIIRSLEGADDDLEAPGVSG